MTIPIVIDACIALAWCFPDETSASADAVLVAMEGHTILVSAVWSLELANAVLTGERHKRLSQLEIKSFTELLSNLTIVIDAQTTGEHIANVVPLARAHNLSAYDAAYLELAIRRSAPIATLDNKLQRAAKQEGVRIFDPSVS